MSSKTKLNWKVYPAGAQLKIFNDTKDIYLCRMAYYQSNSALRWSAITYPGPGEGIRIVATGNTKTECMLNVEKKLLVEVRELLERLG